MKIKTSAATILLLNIICSTMTGNAFAGARDQEMLTLTPDQMALLERDPVAARKDPEIKAQLDRIFSSVLVDNSATRNGAKPYFTDYKGAKCFGVANWNEECSINVAPKIVPMIKNVELYKADVKGGKPTDKALRQFDDLKHANVLVMEEMRVGATDIGTKNAPREMARALGMNYAFFPSQVSLSVKGNTVPNGPVDPKNPLHYNGHLGMALLSRYEIGPTKSVQLQSPTYDWVKGELTKVTPLEATKRGFSKAVLGMDQHQEVQVGNAGYTITELKDPALPNGKLTVVGVHLEVRVAPEIRAKQMKEIQAAIQNIPGRKIMIGDFNTAGTDVSPDSIAREVVNAAKNPETAVSIACAAAAPTGVGSLRTLANAMKNHRNPQALNIPAIFPNKEAALFTGLKEFRFADGSKFDFRNNREHQAGSPSLTFRDIGGNANQIAPYLGFEDTYRMPAQNQLVRDVTSRRLDWMFSDTGSDKNSFKNTFVQGETFNEFNRKGRENHPLSDHSPIFSFYLLEEPSKR